MPDITLIEGYLKSLDGDRRAVEVLVRFRPGQYATVSLVAALVKSGVARPRANQIARAVEAEAVKILGGLERIRAALAAQDREIRAILAE